MSLSKSRDAEGFRIVDKYKTRKNDVEVIEAGDSGQMVLKMGIAALESGRSGRDYPCTPQGFALFKKRSREYFLHVYEYNESQEEKKKLLVDIEGWALSLGTTRKSLLDWEKNRPAEWREYIAACKTLITQTKKNLGMMYKIPPAVLIFDLKNNSGYTDTAELNITAIDGRSKEVVLEDELANRGLVWDPITQDYVPATVLPDKGEVE